MHWNYFVYKWAQKWLYLLLVECCIVDVSMCLNKKKSVFQSFVLNWIQQQFSKWRNFEILLMSDVWFNSWFKILFGAFIFLPETDMEFIWRLAAQQ